jgi:hypothetical protein
MINLMTHTSGFGDEGLAYWKSVGKQPGEI